MADPVVILHIVADLNTLGVSQLGVQLNPDADLGFRMYGGKDAAGALTQWLAKNKAGSLASLLLQDQTGGGDTAIYADTAGQIVGASKLPGSVAPNHDDLEAITGTPGEYNHPTDAQIAAIGGTSGTYTATISSKSSGIQFVEASPLLNWFRVGDTVTVFGSLQISGVTGGVSASFDISGPVASNFTNTSDSSGTTISNVSGGEHSIFTVNANTLTNLIIMGTQFNYTALYTHRVNFSYVIK